MKNFPDIHPDSVLITTDDDKIISARSDFTIFSLNLHAVAIIGKRPRLSQIGPYGNVLYKARSFLLLYENVPANCRFKRSYHALVHPHLDLFTQEYSQYLDQNVLQIDCLQ